MANDLVKTAALFAATMSVVACGKPLLEQDSIVSVRRCDIDRSLGRIDLTLHSSTTIRAQRMNPGTLIFDEGLYRWVSEIDTTSSAFDETKSTFGITLKGGVLLRLKFSEDQSTCVAWMEDWIDMVEPTTHPR